MFLFNSFMVISILKYFYDLLRMRGLDSNIYIVVIHKLQQIDLFFFTSFAGFLVP